MGLFGWGKKKPTQAEQINEAFTNAGAQTNEVKQPEKMDRITAAKKAELERKSALQKEQILGKLVDI